MGAKTAPALEVSSQKLQAQLSEQGVVKTGGLGWYFGFFFLSGFCSLLYELVWLRLAMAQFGVTTPMISMVLSSFMAGLGIGSWGAGRFLRKYAGRIAAPPLHLYAIAEVLIGCSAVVVPLELRAGRVVLEHVGKSLSLSSGGYYVAAGVWLACSLIPWCACMGATIPLGMYAIGRERPLESRRSFSFLYLANVLGAVAGTTVPLLLIELWGFSFALQTGMVLNLAICSAAYLVATKRSQRTGSASSDLGASQDGVSAQALGGRELLRSSTLWLLFATGLTSMGMEVVWTRQYTTYVGTLVYSFAIILGVYLAATFLGSSLYRWWSRRYVSDSPLLWLFVWLAALLPLLAADLRIGMVGWLRVPVGIAAFSGLLGFLTPMLVDRFSEGDANRAGVAYAVNVAGCIAGPLVAGFVLLPHLDERYALTLLALPWLLVGVWLLSFRELRSRARSTARLAISVGLSAVILPASYALIFHTQDYIQQIHGARVLRDSTATVIASGQGMQKRLYVNGISMTLQTPITKVMATMPLAFLDHAPQSALVICFGMGTTHRSMLSWGIDSTAIDLVPSVPALFSYYHADAPQLLSSPRSHLVVDDGRRFLERTTSQYDVIVIDPPPPIAAAGSSLLYSSEFYAAAQKRLRPDGILVQWFPGGDRTTTASVARSLQESFPYVRAFVAFEGWGIHYLASQQPIPNRSAAELAKRIPPAAAADLVEWGPLPTAEQELAAMLKNEVPVDQIVAVDKNAPSLQDDQPVNEYGLLRHWLAPQ